MHLHSADITQAFLPPDLPVKLVCGKEGVGMPDEEGQDAVLHVGQMDAPAILFHAMAVGIQRKGRTVVAADAGLCGIHLDTADVCHDAGQQNFVVIGLGQEIIAAQFQCPYHCVCIVQTGSKNDGAVVPAAQALTQIHAVGVRQKDIHQDHIELFPGVAQRFAAGVSTDHLKILLTFQEIAGSVPDHRIIFHQKNADHAVCPPLFGVNLL